MGVISKAALTEGMSNYVLVVYRHAIPFSFPLSHLLLTSPSQPLPTTPSFSLQFRIQYFHSNLSTNNIAPQANQTQDDYFYICKDFASQPIGLVWLTLFLHHILDGVLLQVKLMSIHSQAKMAGTGATVAAAMIMTLVRVPTIHLPWMKEGRGQTHQKGQIDLHHSIKGVLMITIGCFSWAFFVILQAITLRTYPAELPLTAWICLLGTAEGVIVALVMEKERATAWSLKWDTKLLAATYGGVFCSGIAYYVQGVVVKERGPVFVTAFSPPGLVIVAILSSLILAEQVYLGRVIGAIVIIVGLYLVVWGERKDCKASWIEEKQRAVNKSVNMKWGSYGHSELEIAASIRRPGD